MNSLTMMAQNKSRVISGLRALSHRMEGVPSEKRSLGEQCTASPKSFAFSKSLDQSN